MVVYGQLECECLNGTRCSYSPDGLLAFLWLGEKTAIMCFRQIASNDSLKSWCRWILVTSGISGIGETRMLQHGVTILKRMKLENVARQESSIRDKRTASQILF